MMIVLPLLFTAFYWVFWGFTLGDWSWPSHLMLMTGMDGNMARFFHATLYSLGMFASVCFGVMAHD